MPHKPFPVSEWELAFIFPFGQKRSLSPHEFVLLSVTALVALYFVPKIDNIISNIFNEGCFDNKNPKQSTENVMEVNITQSAAEDDLC
jgi:hypothetical protein